GLLPLLHVRIIKPEGRVGLGKRRIKFQRPRGRLKNFWETFVGLFDPVDASPGVVIGDPDMSESVVRVEFYRPLKSADRFWKRSRNELVPEIAPLQVSVVSLGAVGAALGQLLFFFARQMRQKLRRHLFGNRIFQFKDVS